MRGREEHEGARVLGRTRRTGLEHLAVAGGAWDRSQAVGEKRYQKKDQAEHTSWEPRSLSRAEKQPWQDLLLSRYINSPRKVLIIIEKICFSLSPTLSIYFI